MPIYRLLVFIAVQLANKDASEESETVTMKLIAEWAGLPTDSFEVADGSGFVSPETAAGMFRR